MEEALQRGIDILKKMYQEHPDIQSLQLPLDKQLILDVVTILTSDFYSISKKRLLNLDQGYVLEFFYFREEGDLITRLVSPDSESSPWVISDRNFVVNELTRVIGKRTKEIEEFALYDPRIYKHPYDSYPTTDECIKLFGVYYKEADYESVTMNIAIISIDEIAYWVSVGFSGIQEKGWLDFEDLIPEIMRVRSKY